MAHKNRDGKWIIAAGEIAAYTVCPEAWKLRTIDKKLSTDLESSVIEGKELHSKWAKSMEDSLLLTRVTRATLALLCTLVVMVLFFWAL